MKRKLPDSLSSNSILLFAKLGLPYTQKEMLGLRMLRILILPPALPTDPPLISVSRSSMPE